MRVMPASRAAAGRARIEVFVMANSPFHATEYQPDVSVNVNSLVISPLAKRRLVALIALVNQSQC